MDRTARVWDARTGASLVQLSGHLDGVDSAAFSPDGNRIVTGSHDATARIWDARTGTQLRVLTGHLDRVSSVTYSADGRHVLTASMDRTARIWDAQVPAALDAQVAWFRATETDALPETMLVHLGLAQSANSNDSSAPATSCDQASAAIYDPDRTSPGAILDASTADAAASACAAEFSEPQHDARVEYQLGRIRVAQRDFTSAKLLLETAVSKGYRAAQIDLGNLLMEPSAKLLDPAQAVLLYRHAWQDGVAIAAFELGRVYEHGLPSSSGNETAAFSSDPETVWRWYQNGADAHEPHALARFAERDERDALDEPDATKRRSRLLQAFTLYATAAERATREEWPQNASQNWRYRRATIAWGLANEGMMQQVAEAYEAVVNPARSTR
jgi:WD40 repeat protein